MKRKFSSRTFKIIALSIAVCAIAAGMTYWHFYGTKSPEITSKWLESGGIDSVMAKLADKIPEPKEFNTSAAEIAVRKAGEEIVSLRTANEQVFKGSKPGEFQAKIYLSPVNYFDKTDSTYKPIDTSIHQISDLAKSDPARKFDEYVDAGVYQATWFADKPWDYKMYVGTSWIQYKALFSESDVLDIKVETLKTGLKETITLKDNTAPTKLQWTVTQSTGQSAIITPPPTAEDANGKEVKVISYQVGDILTYQVDTAGAVFPIEVDPTSVIATRADDIYSASATYTTARNAITGGNTSINYVAVGQYYSGTYFVLRAFFSFPIPDMTTLTAASLFLEGKNDQSATNFEIYIHTSTQSNPTVNEDFDQFAGWQASGGYNGTILNNSWNSVSYSADWNEIVFNAAGLAAILAKKNSAFLVAAISKNDYDSTAPSTSSNEYVQFESPTAAGKEPYLYITYTAAPTVTTQSASSVNQTTATLNGNITATGGANATVRGFAWGTNSALSGGNTATTTENGSFGTGAFTNTSLTFTCNTTYYSRAYATNTAGTGLGAISASFTTSACAPPAPINGACAATHYSCTSPAPSTNQSDNPSTWTWSCPGSNGGSTAQCSETKSITPPANACLPLYLAPTHIYTQQSSGGTVTHFTRTIQVKDVPNTNNDKQVVSTVSWSFHNRAYSVTVTDHLTPWQ